MIDGGAQLSAVPHAMREVSGELLHFAHTIRLLPLDQHGVVCAHHLVAIPMAGMVVGAGREILRDLFSSVALIGGSFSWALGSVLSKRWQSGMDVFSATG